jgi:drug/metabolite transporter, DME family
LKPCARIGTVPTMTPSRARLLVLLTAVLFSTGGAAIKACTLSGAQVACFRSGIATLALLAFAPAARRRPDRATLLTSVAYAATVLLFVMATKLTTAANAIFLQSTAPIWLLLLSPLLLREPVRGRDLWVMLIVSAGLALVLLGEERPQASAPDPVLGNALALASSVTFALLLAGLRWLGARGGGPLPAVVQGNLLACLVALPAALPVAQVSAADVGVLLFLGCVQIGLAYTLLCAAVPHVPALQASLLLLIEPALNPLWTWITQGEVPGALAVAGGMVILAATVVQAAQAGRAQERPGNGSATAP